MYLITVTHKNAPTRTGLQYGPYQSRVVAELRWTTVAQQFDLSTYRVDMVDLDTGPALTTI